MTCRTLASAVSFLAVTGLIAISAGAQRRFSADDMVKIVRVGDPQISPDGKTIAITVGRANLKTDHWDGELDLVDVATHELRAVTHGRVGVSHARWSPSGDSLAYLADDAEGKTQIFMLPMRGGDSQPVTHSKTPVSTFAWRPDGKGFAYAAADEVPERKDEAKFEDAFEVGNNSYLDRAASVPVHLWTVSIGGEAKRLTSGTWSLPVFKAPGPPPSPFFYTPDGASIVFVHAASPITGDMESMRLYTVDVATGAVHAMTQATVGESNPVLSPDGTKVAYSFPRDGKRRNEDSIYVTDLHGVTPHDVTASIDHDITAAEWMPDGAALLVESNADTSSALWLQTPGGAAKRLELGSLCPGAYNVGHDGSLAFTATDATHPSELFYASHAGDTPVQLTHLQTATGGATLGRQETISWKSDSFTVDGVLTYPPDYVAGRKYPLVLYLHGGPTATSLATFTAPSQVLAAQGWLVLEPNYRGSNNLGNAFQAAIVNDASMGPGRDIMAGVKAMEARGIVDEKKIAVTGWSYGGQMTAWMIGNYPDVWRAAVAGAPVTDLVDQYTLSDNNVMRAAGYGPSPFRGDSLKAYAAQSPISYAWRVKTPTLIMSDVGDWRVTTTQAYKLYHALSDNNVPVKFVAFPVPGHSPADPIRSRDVWRRWTAWLKTYMDDAPAAP